MQVKTITEANITDAISYLNYDRTLIEEDFLLHKIRSKEFFVLGCYDDFNPLGLAILTNRGHVACLHVKDLWKNRGLEKLLFQEIYQICANQLRISCITATVSKADIAMFSYLGFRICQREVALDESAPVSMQFLIYPGDIKPASSSKGLIIGLSIGGGLLILIAFLIFAFFFTQLLKYDLSHYDDWSNYIYDDYKYDDYEYDDYEYDDYQYNDFNYDEEYDDEPLVLNPYAADDLPYHIEESSFTDYYHDEDTYIDFEVYYPQLIGTGSEYESQINLRIRDRAMKNTEDFYLHPTEENTQEWADNEYLYLSSVVDYQIGYMDENFVSIIIRDHYFWGSIFGEFEDIYTLNINLKDGTVYDVYDFININDDFTEMWIKTMLEEDPDCAPLLYLKPELFTEMLLSEYWVEGRYYTNFFVSGDGIHMELVYHYRDDSLIARGWVNTPFPTEDLTPYRKDCPLWDLITPVIE